jgi:hypothetical protein
LTTGSTCKHCGQRFCYEHALPEEHGCSDAARADARATLLAKGTTPPPMKEWKRDYLLKQLHEKISDAREEGDGKSKKKKKEESTKK